MQQTGGQGRCSLVTFLSKTTVNKVISTVQQIIQETIAKDVKEVQMFSVQIDTTQDIPRAVFYSVKASAYYSDSVIRHPTLLLRRPLELSKFSVGM